MDSLRPVFHPASVINRLYFILTPFRKFYFSRAGHLWAGPTSERILPGHWALAARLLSERRLRCRLWPGRHHLTRASHPALGGPRHQVPSQLRPLQPGELSTHPHRLREWEQVRRRIRWESVQERVRNNNAVVCHVYEKPGVREKSLRRLECKVCENRCQKCATCDKTFTFICFWLI